MGENHPNLAFGLNNLALLHYDRGTYVKAEELLRRALAIEEKTYGADHPELISTLENYAAVLRELRRYSEADEMNARAKSLASSFERDAPGAGKTAPNGSVPRWRGAQDQDAAERAPRPTRSPSRSPSGS